MDKKEIIYLNLLLISLFVLMYGSFQAGQMYICEKSDMKLLLHPYKKCITKIELDSLNTSNDKLFATDDLIICNDPQYIKGVYYCSAG